MKKHLTAEEWLKWAPADLLEMILTSVVGDERSDAS